MLSLFSIFLLHLSERATIFFRGFQNRSILVLALVFRLRRYNQSLHRLRSDMSTCSLIDVVRYIANITFRSTHSPALAQVPSYCQSFPVYRRVPAFFRAMSICSRAHFSRTARGNTCSIYFLRRLGVLEKDGKRHRARTRKREYRGRRPGKQQSVRMGMMKFILLFTTD